MVKGPSGANSVSDHTCKWLTKLEDCEAGVQFVNHEYDYKQNWMKISPVTN